MQWQFHKCLETFQGYRKTNLYKKEIEKGQTDVLLIVIRELKLIISDPREKITVKVLALRFIKDIMILGKMDIVESIEPLVPELMKICSHEMQSINQDRGQSFFMSHHGILQFYKEYIRADYKQKTKINTLGSTYFILALESILHWAKWIPIYQSGIQSIYSKAYKNLLQRGIVFPKIFHFYKQSDTQKYQKIKQYSQIQSYLSNVIFYRYLFSQLNYF